MLEGLSFRYSTTKDTEEITELLYESFGSIAKDGGALNNIGGRYLCAIYDHAIIAISGISFSEEFNGKHQLTWTCTKPSMRGKGIMSELIKRVLSITDEEMYCECWGHLDGQEHLGNILNKLGFKRIIQDYKLHDVRYNCLAKIPSTCPYYTGQSCRCHQSLYNRDGNSKK